MNLSKNLKQLNNDGFTKVTNAISNRKANELLNLINKEYDRINKYSKYTYPGAPDRDKSDKILYNIHNLNYKFVKLLSNKSLEYLAMNKLNDPYYRFLPKNVPNYCLSYFNARSSGSDLALHIDSNIPFKGKYTSAMQFIFFLEDSTIENGCSIVVPKSHQSGKFTNRKTKKYIPLIAKKGDLVAWDSRLWHGTLKNLRKVSRWALVITMTMWWVKPSMDIVRSMNKSIYNKCSNKEKQLLGFCAVPPINNIGF